VKKADLIKCVQRELAMRERVYPKWIEAKRMTREQATHEYRCMKAIARIINQLSENQIAELGESSSGKE
jgi:hypothetical protein